MRRRGTTGETALELSSSGSRRPRVQSDNGPPTRKSSTDKAVRGIHRHLHKIGKAGWVVAAVMATACVVVPYFDWQVQYCPSGGSMSDCITAGVRFSPLTSDCYVSETDAKAVASDPRTKAFYDRFGADCPFADMNGFGALLSTFVPITVVISAIVAVSGWNFVPRKKMDDLVCCAPRASALILVIFAVAHLLYIWKAPPVLQATFEDQQTNELCISFEPGRPSLRSRLPGGRDNKGYCMSCLAMIPDHFRADIYGNKVECHAHISPGYQLAIASSLVGVFFFVWVIRWPVDPKYKDWTPITWSQPGYDWLSLDGPVTG